MTKLGEKAKIIKLHEKSRYLEVVDTNGTTLLVTRHRGVAEVFVEVFNNRGSDFDLETGAWL